MTPPREVLTRDRTSGRVHRRFWARDHYAVDERCNLDQAGTYDEIESLVDIDPEQLCGHCFPPEAA